MNPSELELDDKGFLRSPESWTEDKALALADLENIILTNAHWEILHLVREFHATYELSPVNRSLVNWIREKLGDEKGNSIYLMKLFPGSPARVASRIAGLPKPHNCL